MRTSHKILETITSKNIVNDGQIQIIASEAIVTFVQNTSGSHRFEKKTIAIASAQKFDHRSSPFGAIQFMRKIWKNEVQGFLSNICVLLCLSARKSKKTNIAIKWSMNKLQQGITNMSPCFVTLTILSNELKTFLEEFVVSRFPKVARFPRFFCAPFSVLIFPIESVPTLVSSVQLRREFETWIIGKVGPTWLIGTGAVIALMKRAINTNLVQI